MDYALELVNLGIERFVDDLGDLRDDLLTLETLVYECRVEDSLGLSDIQAMPDIDKLRLMMMGVGPRISRMRLGFACFFSVLCRRSIGASSACFAHVGSRRRRCT